MTPEAYEAWYASARGRWIGDTEYALLRSMLRPERGHSLVDVGCGTGHFTRQFARDLAGEVVGVDPDGASLAYARAHVAGGERYVEGVAEALPFPDVSFDCAACVTALCFVRDQRAALSEMVRVARRRIVLGLLNRRSLLFRRKGQEGSEGAYAGAHWHDPAEIRALLAGLPVDRVRLRSAIVLPGGGTLARAVESTWPRGLLLGGFLAVVADVVPARGTLAR